MREWTDADVDDLDLAALVAEVGHCLRDLGGGEAHQAAKQILPSLDSGFLISIAATVPRLGLAVAKWGSYRPGTAERPSRTTAELFVTRLEEGGVVGVVRGTRATELRTAATVVAVHRAMRDEPAASLGLVGFGPTNRAVLDVLLGAGAAPERVRIRLSRAPKPEAHVALAAAYPGLDVAFSRDLANPQLAVSATGSKGQVADLAEIDSRGVVVSLDGSDTWRPRAAARLDDRAEPGRPSPLARAMHRGLRRPGRIFLDVAGSAVTDVALAALLPGVRP